MVISSMKRAAFPLSTLDAQLANKGIVVAFIALLMSCIPKFAIAESVQITADFSTGADYPLVKTKFGVFNSGMVRPDRYARDINLFGEVHPDSLRIDLGWGARWIGWKPEPISGTADNLHYDFRGMDRIARLLQTQNVLAYWSYCYTPPPLQPKPGNYRAVPTDLTAWARILKTVAAHYRQFPGGNPVGYQEICNEPDNRDFFTGTRDDYLNMYRLGSKAVREGDSDAVVGGPALAFSNSWIEPFLDMVVRDRLPLDFFSFHYYPGCPYTPADLHGVVKLMATSLDRHPELRTTELHLNEFNSFRIDYPKGGTQDRIPIAAAFLHDVAYFLTQPALTRVYWAQFQDSGGGNFSGMIDMDGHRKALFNAYAAYAQMPIDRNQLTIDGKSGIEGFASSDPFHQDVLLWNRSGKDQAISLDLKSANTDGGLSVFRIDRQHASHGDGSPEEWMQPEPIDPRPPHHWSGTLPRDGIVLLAAKASTTTPFRTVNPPGKVVRELHDYSNRASRAYADFDRNTWTARLGMAGETKAVARVGVSAADLPDRLSITTQTDGKLLGGSISLRIDYRESRGYDKSVVFCGPVSDAVRRAPGMADDAPPWGTRRRPDEVIEALDADRSQPRKINLKDHAPSGWTGRADLTFTLQDAAPTARVVLRLAR
jgi:xylan 1,4-beta-xylosidase